MGMLESDTLVRRFLPAWLILLSLIAIVEVGISGYLTGKGDSVTPMSARTSSRFALFTSLWVILFGSIVAVGTLKRLRFINTGAVHLVYLTVTLAFWIAVGASFQRLIYNGIPYQTTMRACEWIGWVEAIFTVLTYPWVLLGVAHAKEGIRGSVAV